MTADNRCEPVVLALLPSAFERAEIADALGPAGSAARTQREAELREQAGERAAAICRTARVHEEHYRAGFEEATRTRWPRLRVPRAATWAAQVWWLVGVFGPGVYVAVGETQSGWAERLAGAVLLGPMLLGLCILAVKLVRWIFRRPARPAFWRALMAYNLLNPPLVVAELVWDSTGGNVLSTLLLGILTAVVGAGSVLIIVGDLDPLELATAADRAHVRELEKAWRAVLLEEGLLPVLRQLLNATLRKQQVATELSISDAPGLRNLSDLSFQVPTAAGAELVRLTERMGSGTLALCGPRGVGKTLLLRAFCAGRFDREHPADDLSIIVPAPVQYDRREFMLHLYGSACRSVVLYAEKHSGLDDVARDAAARFEQVRFLQTYSREMSGQLGVRGSGVGAKRGVALARQPLTYPEVVADLREFLTTAASTLRGHGERAGTTVRLLVGIDELDRIQPAERARDFIDEIKVIFEIPNCLYLVSVSDEALRAAALASPGRRDAFDSAIDEVLRVGYLDLDTAVRLLDRRVVGLPLPFAALAHALSGGLARDLLRTARTMVETRTGRLPEVARGLVTGDFTQLIQATGATLAATDLDDPSFQVMRLLEDALRVPQDSDGLREVSARVAACAENTTGDGKALLVTIALRIDHLAAVSSAFGTELTEERIDSAVKPGPASFDALARICRTVGSNNALARLLLDDFRAHWPLPAKDA